MSLPHKLKLNKEGFSGKLSDIKGKLFEVRTADGSNGTWDAWEATKEVALDVAIPSFLEQIP